MLRNYLITALRNLMRNRLYAAISILGLAVAFAAAILIGQFVRGEFGYDRWLPGHQQVYAIANVLDLPGQPCGQGRRRFGARGRCVLVLHPCNCME